MEIVANALEGNVSNIPFIEIKNPDGARVFYGQEDVIWTNRELLNRECSIMSGHAHRICILKDKWYGNEYNFYFETLEKGGEK